MRNARYIYFLPNCLKNLPTAIPFPTHMVGSLFRVRVAMVPEIEHFRGVRLICSRHMALGHNFAEWVC